MIVLLIIGLLAAIAVPNFQNARSKTRTNACINNLRLLDAAKEQYAIDNDKDSTTTPVSSDLTTYLKSNEMPSCPAAGAYTIGVIGTDPTCDQTDHELPS